jgi:hypothetical protein
MGLKFSIVFILPKPSTFIIRSCTKLSNNNSTNLFFLSSSGILPRKFLKFSLFNVPVLVWKYETILLGVIELKSVIEFIDFRYSILLVLRLLFFLSGLSIVFLIYSLFVPYQAHPIILIIS